MHRAGTIIPAALIILLTKLRAISSEVFSMARVLTRPRQGLALAALAHPEVDGDRMRARVEGHMTKNTLFSAFGDDEMRTLVESMRPRVVEAGEVVIEKGTEAKSMYVVTSGSLNCTIPIDGEPKNLKTCYTGDIFGELAVIYDRPRAANVVCWDPAVVWELDKKVFWEATKKNKRQNRVVQSVFDFFDTDMSRKVDKKEVRAAVIAMGESISDEKLNELFLQFDYDGDGEINLHEFSGMMSAWQADNS